MDEAERNAWRDESAFFTEEWVEKMSKKGIKAQAFVDQMNALRAKYEAELKEKGYPWTR